MCALTCLIVSSVRERCGLAHVLFGEKWLWLWGGRGWVLLAYSSEILLLGGEVDGERDQDNGVRKYPELRSYYHEVDKLYSFCYEE